MFTIGPFQCGNGRLVLGSKGHFKFKGLTPHPAGLGISLMLDKLLLRVFLFSGLHVKLLLRVFLFSGLHVKLLLRVSSTFRPTC